MDNDITISISGKIFTKEFEDFCSIYCNDQNVYLHTNQYDLMIPIKKLHDLYLMQDERGYFVDFSFGDNSVCFTSQSEDDLRQLLRLIYLYGGVLSTRDIISCDIKKEISPSCNIALSEICDSIISSSQSPEIRYATIRAKLDSIDSSHRSMLISLWNWLNSWSWTKQLHQDRLLHSLSETYFFLFEMSSSSSSFAPDDSYVFKSKLCCAVDLKLEKRVVIRKAPKPSSALSSVLLLFLLSLPDRASRLSSSQQARRVSSLSEQRGPVRSLLL